MIRRPIRLHLQNTKLKAKMLRSVDGTAEHEIPSAGPLRMQGPLEHRGLATADSQESLLAQFETRWGSGQDPGQSTKRELRGSVWDGAGLHGVGGRAVG